MHLLSTVTFLLNWALWLQSLECRNEMLSFAFSWGCGPCQKCRCARARYPKALHRPWDCWLQLLPVKLVTSHGTFIITVFLDPDKNKYFDGVLVLYMVSFKLFNNSWVWGRKSGLVSRDPPHFTSFLTIPSFSHPASPFFVKIKSIVAVGLCCILRKGGWGG